MSMLLRKSIQDLHWGQLTTLWVAVGFAWIVTLSVAFTLSPNGQASNTTEAYLFALLVLGIAIMLGVTFTWFGGRKRLRS